MAETQPLLTEGEAAARLRVCPRTLRKERQAGRLAYILIGRRVLYAPGDLDTYLDRVRQTVPQPRKKPPTPKHRPNRSTGVIVPFSQREGIRR